MRGWLIEVIYKHSIPSPFSSYQVYTTTEEEGEEEDTTTDLCRVCRLADEMLLHHHVVVSLGHRPVVVEIINGAMVHRLDHNRVASAYVSVCDRRRPHRRVAAHSRMECTKLLLRRHNAAERAGECECECEYVSTRA